MDKAQAMRLAAYYKCPRCGIDDSLFFDGSRCNECGWESPEEAKKSRMIRERRQKKELEIAIEKAKILPPTKELLSALNEARKNYDDARDRSWTARENRRKVLNEFKNDRENTELKSNWEKLSREYDETELEEKRLRGIWLNCYENLEMAELARGKNK